MRTEEIHSLTGLRGIAALWVFAYHSLGFLQGHPSREYVYAIAGAGYLGVDLFFVLSGFVLAYNYSGAGLHRSTAAWGGFLWKRLARIYPVHLAALALLVISVMTMIALDVPYAGLGRLTPEGLLKSLTLTHAWAYPVQKTWNVVSWSISSEWAAYLVFPVVALMAARVRTAAGCIALIGLLYAALFSQIYFGTFAGTMAYAVPRIGCEFAAGVLLHRLYVLHSVSSTAWDRVALTATVALLFGSSLVASRFGASMAFAAMPVVACLIVYALARAEGGYARWLSGQAMQYAGRVSYSFYMVHMIVLSFISSVLKERQLMDEHAIAVAGVGAGFLLALALSHWFYRSIELPARTWMLSRRRRTARVGQPETQTIG